MTSPIAPREQTAANRRQAIDWYRLSAADAARQLGTSPTTGLSDAQARQRLAQYGPNEVAERGGPSRWQILVGQLTGVMTVVLFGAAIVSVFLGDLLDAAVILAIVVLNAALGFSQEFRAEQSMAALKRLSAPTVRVRRDGNLHELSARDIVPGDVVLLETGNVVPADARLLQSSNLRVQEATLTGESEPVEKDAEVAFTAERALADRQNMVFSGTIVSYGHGEAVVAATGMASELGTIAGWQGRSARRRAVLVGPGVRAYPGPDSRAGSRSRGARWPEVNGSIRPASTRPRRTTPT
jgi:Ca2+-transporting ATPase